jgi:nitrilase
VLSCNQFARRRDYPDDYPAFDDLEPDGVICAGGSCIVSPLGEIVAGPDYEGETVLTAEIDLDEIARGKFDFDVVGHYARPDIFRLEVDEQAKPVVVRAPRGTAAEPRRVDAS